MLAAAEQETLTSFLCYLPVKQQLDKTKKKYLEIK